MSYYLEVYQRLQRLNLTVSHSFIIRLVERVGKNYDERVKAWRDSIITQLDDNDKIVSGHTHSKLILGTFQLSCFLCSELVGLLGLPGMMTMCLYQTTPPLKSPVTVTQSQILIRHG